MSKYNITITEIYLDKNTHTAQGILIRNGEEIKFNAETIWWEGTRRWKVVEGDRLAVSLENSSFSRGERMGIARWLAEVSKNPELFRKSSSQGTGFQGNPRAPQANAQVQELESQNKLLQEQMLQLQALMTQLLEEKESKNKKK